MSHLKGMAMKSGKYSIWVLLVLVTVLFGCGGESEVIIPSTSNNSSNTVANFLEDLPEEDTQTIDEIAAYLNSIDFYNSYDISVENIEDSLSVMSGVNTVDCELNVCTVILGSDTEKQFFRSIY